ncbi:hypothetical protein ZIOFF_019114 [Zingiber officinale]|uniref:Receptor-like serine/threonine-protein kinase n=1 Tax=Zingiber officinale TaxID=94328 RepID=A0A8J5HDU1_ZINOF|nr:hypothetical protein ZIOFF_019114 [Zingiber officinale]
MARMEFLVAVLTLFLIVTLSAAVDTLTPQQPLLDDDDDGGAFDLISAGGKFQLGFFSPSSSINRYVGIWFHNISVQSVVWVANRDHPIASRACRLSLTPNGTLVISDDESTIYWSSANLFTVGRPVAQLLDDANFIVREAGSYDPTVDPNSYSAWQSFDFLTDTLLPGMKLGWNLTSRLDRKLTLSVSNDDPTTGNYTLGVELEGDTQEFLRQGTKAQWRSGPWNGLYFSGVPRSLTESFVGYYMLVISEEVAHSYFLHNPSVIMREVLTPSGLMSGEVWSESAQSWIVQSYMPMDRCDRVPPCGPNAVCYPNTWPQCKCLPRFHPKNSINWEVIQDTSGGCVRTTALDCSNSTDGIFRKNSVKLPDTSSSSVNRSMSLEECQTWCLMNCSCTSYAASNISSGGTGRGRGCIIWTSDLVEILYFDDTSYQDLYVRLAATDLAAATESNGHNGRSRASVILLAVSFVSTFLLAGVAGSIWLSKKRKSDADEASQATGEDFDLPLFDLSTIAEATANFSVGNKLGEGGFGPVYMGRPRKGQEIAVKRLSKTSTQGALEFKNEVTLIAKLQHRNLVRLLGCCIQRGERILIYEYMPNGSLDTFLFDRDKCALLDWTTRYSIIVGVAKGLLYLHHDSKYRIIHRDLKTSNILLDKDMNPKISDFGIAELFSSDETIGNTKRIVGTNRYMSPEYVMNGIFSMKSDVFNFGMELVERNSALEVVDSFAYDERLCETATASQRGCAFATFLHGCTSTSDTLHLKVLSLWCGDLRAVVVAGCHLLIFFI